MLTIIWLLVWLFNGHPWLLSEWGPWNISLLVCFLLDGGWSIGARGRSLP